MGDRRGARGTECRRRSSSSGSERVRFTGSAWERHKGREGRYEAKERDRDDRERVCGRPKEEERDAIEEGRHQDRANGKGDPFQQKETE